MDHSQGAFSRHRFSWKKRDVLEKVLLDNERTRHNSFLRDEVNNDIERFEAIAIPAAKKNAEAQLELRDTSERDIDVYGTAESFYSSSDESDYQDGPLAGLSRRNEKAKQLALKAKKLAAAAPVKRSSSPLIVGTLKVQSMPRSVDDYQYYDYTTHSRRSQPSTSRKSQEGVETYNEYLKRTGTTKDDVVPFVIPDRPTSASGNWSSMYSGSPYVGSTVDSGMESAARTEPLSSVLPAPPSREKSKRKNKDEVMKSLKLDEEKIKNLQHLQKEVSTWSRRTTSSRRDDGPQSSFPAPFRLQASENALVHSAASDGLVNRFERDTMLSARTTGSVARKLRHSLRSRRPDMTSPTKNERPDRSDARSYTFRSSHRPLAPGTHDPTVPELDTARSAVRFRDLVEEFRAETATPFHDRPLTGSSGKSRRGQKSRQQHLQDCVKDMTIPPRFVFVPSTVSRMTVQDAVFCRPQTADSKRKKNQQKKMNQRPAFILTFGNRDDFGPSRSKAENYKVMEKFRKIQKQLREEAEGERSARVREMRVDTRASLIERQRQNFELSVRSQQPHAMRQLRRCLQLMSLDKQMPIIDVETEGTRNDASSASGGTPPRRRRLQRSSEAGEEIANALDDFDLKLNGFA